MRVILIGKSSGRLDCLAEAITNSKNTELFILTDISNPELEKKGFVSIGKTNDQNYVLNFAKNIKENEIIRGKQKIIQETTIAVISDEESLAAGVVDTLKSIDILSVGPTKNLSQIESSKTFTRQLLERNKLGFMNPLWGSFNPNEINRVESYMHAFKNFVIKPDGLTNGKGVKVLNKDFFTINEGLKYCKEIFDTGEKLLIEQQQIGHEFSLMSFSDGNTIIDMPIVQDYKRLLDLDMGPNTGGMGSICDPKNKFSYIPQYHFEQASWTNRKVIEVLQKDCKEPYKGIIYGNFISTNNGLKIIEYNARFGDPEIINILPILDTDFGDILFDITRGKLNKKNIKFKNKATVCKYLVPIGYPNNSKQGFIDTKNVLIDNTTRIYFGSLDGNKITNSRSIAVVGISDDIYMAGNYAEFAAQQIKGPLFYRKDIGTFESLQRKINNTNLITEWQ
jgi:fusion protein PurCD